MSALLSPPRPVRTRFKVPGEGAYELCTELPPPPTLPPPPPKTPATPTPATPPPTPTYTAGPLGLPKVTKLTFAQHATLHPPAPPPPDAPATPPPMFSFRKLTTITSPFKFSTDTAEDPPSPAVTSATATPGPRAPPRIAPANPDTPPAGVLAYNASDAVVLLDMRPSPAPTLTLHTRTPPSAQRLQSTPEALKLLIGCANGEVAVYPDVTPAPPATAPPDAAGKKHRSVSAVATLASVASAITPASPPAPPSFVYNKDGATNATRVVAVACVPDSQFRFLSAHVDASIIIYDSRFKPTPATLRAATAPVAPPPEADASATGSASTAPRTAVRNGEKPPEKGDNGTRDERPLTTVVAGEKASPSPTHRRTGSLVGGSGGNSAAGTLGQHEMLVTKQAKGKRSNPVAVWQIGRSPITACEFSPDMNSEGSRLMAVTGRDGYLRIIDFTKEVPVSAFRSYFGAFLCVAWSPDGKYIATGGEDDLVSIWCPSEERLVARLEGHTSWVSAVAWDSSLSAPGRYRIGSAGQDAKLLLWDFALDVLHHRSPQSRLGTGVVRLRSYVCDVNNAPSAATSSGSSMNGPVGNGSASGQQTVERKASKLSRLRGHSSSAAQSDGEAGGAHYAVPIGTPVIVSALGRAEVPIVEPVVAHVAHGEPLTDVWFQESGVFTADSVGNVKMWSRPAAHAVPVLSLEGGMGVAPGRKGPAADLD